MTTSIKERGRELDIMSLWMEEFNSTYQEVLPKKKSNLNLDQAFRYKDQFKEKRGQSNMLNDTVEMQSAKSRQWETSTRYTILQQTTGKGREEGDWVRVYHLKAFKRYINQLQDEIQTRKYIWY